MTDDTTSNQWSDNPSEPFSSGGESTNGGTSGTGANGANGRDWMSQLQAMIDNVATQAAPVLRQVAVKAAELAVVAGEKAGPFAHKAADATEAVGVRLAERGREVADQLRRSESESGEAGSTGTTGSTGTAGSWDSPASSSTTESSSTGWTEPGAGATSDPGNPDAGRRPDAADATGE